MKKILSAVALAAACGVASAQGYAGALIGMTEYTEDCPVACDKSDTGFKIYGGYEVMPNLSVEVAYTDFGTLKFNAGGSIEGYAVSAVAAYRYAFTNELSGVGRLGLGYFSQNGKGIPTEDDEFGLYAGLGIEYAINADFKVVGAFDLAKDGDVHIFGIGAQMGF
ncbi:MAG TPA: outer membrane beta-barrel protein [Aquabacterium sp.]|uniref:outer membrane beta-barrel protein n=1 Tax=Aquabacterium sp. TaxID=1872578 RepID=UPI002E327243|nr:outer membrane beta-barrel protein [Aquabacterium sp.]HEX5372563.1 outer membrane beta-barrel protein [Aquabacterium sp.]